jgi:hypothetical protein
MKRSKERKSMGEEMEQKEQHLKAKAVIRG